MTNLIIAGGNRRERSRTLLQRLEGGAGRRWLVAVPCGLPHDMPDGIHGIGLNDLDGALDAAGRVRSGDTLAVESVDYWAMGASEPIPNPDNNPNVARWNAMAVTAARKRARFRHAMQALPDGVTVMMTASTLDSAARSRWASPASAASGWIWTAVWPFAPAWPPENEKVSRPSERGTFSFSDGGRAQWRCTRVDLGHDGGLDGPQTPPDGASFGGVFFSRPYWDRDAWCRGRRMMTQSRKPKGTPQGGEFDRGGGHGGRFRLGA